MLLAFLLLYMIGAGSTWSDEFDDDAPAAPLPFPERVNNAIDAGLGFLLNQQLEDGSWGPCISGGVSYEGRVTDKACYPSGPTAFALFTLASCGVEREELPIRRGLAWLRTHNRHRSNYTTYEAAAAVLALTAVYDQGEALPSTSRPQRKPSASAFSRKDWRMLHDLLKQLAGPGGRQTGGGGWGYYPSMEYADISATQFALLALRAASRAGFPIQELAPLAWRRALDYLLRTQTPDGTYAYKEGESWSVGMTAAGLASLLICREQEQLAGRAPSEEVELSIRRAFELLGRRFTASTNGSDDPLTTPAYHYCHLYAIERVGALANRHRIGSKDWYTYGAEYLLAKQRTDGAWRDRTCMGPEDTLGTCFALLFLKRATPPAVVTSSER